MCYSSILPTTTHSQPTVPPSVVRKVIVCGSTPHKGTSANDTVGPSIPTTFSTGKNLPNQAPFDSCGVPIPPLLPIPPNIPPSPQLMNNIPCLNAPFYPPASPYLLKKFDISFESQAPLLKGCTRFTRKGHEKPSSRCLHVRNDLWLYPSEFNGGRTVGKQGITDRYPGDRITADFDRPIVPRELTLGTSEGFTLQALGRIKLTRRMLRESFSDFLDAPWNPAENRRSKKLSANFGTNFAKLET